MDDKTRAQEYDTLREELLLLGERAHDVWRWGLVSMVAVFGALAVTLVGVFGDYQEPNQTSSPNRLAQFLTTYGTLVAVCFCAFAGGIAVTMSEVRTRVLEEMHRIGAYVAVFHDEVPGRVPDAARQLGWHVWNRIDKVPASETHTNADKLEQRRFHGTSGVYILVLVFIVAGTIAVVDTAGSVNTCGSVAAGGAVAVLVAIWLWALDERTRRDAAMWNRRWAKWARLSEQEINARLVRLGLRPDE